MELTRASRTLAALFLPAILALEGPVAAAVEPAGINGQRILRVGPGRAFLSPSAVAPLVRNDDIIEIDAATYSGDVAVWRAHRLTLRAIGGRAHLDATGTVLPEIKAIWVIKGDDARVENMEFSNARSPDHNGAGIRLEGTGLTVSHSYFHDNETGILAGRNLASDIVIEYSEFAHNGHADGQAHNIYIGEVRSFTLRSSYIHHAYVGSHVKSRAYRTRILFNRIADEADGRGNYLIDLSNGGDAAIVGNVLQQASQSENACLIAFAPEGATHPRQMLRVMQNTMVNDRQIGWFIINDSAATAEVVNNLFVGAGVMLTGLARARGNVVAGGPVTWRWWRQLMRFRGTKDDSNRYVMYAGLQGAPERDYHLQPDSPAIDAGIELAPVDRAAFGYQYHHPADVEPRPYTGRPDAGAFEFSASR